MVNNTRFVCLRLIKNVIQIFLHFFNRSISVAKFVLLMKLFPKHERSVLQTLINSTTHTQGSIKLVTIVCNNREREYCTSNNLAKNLKKLTRIVFLPSLHRIRVLF